VSAASGPRQAEGGNPEGTTPAEVFAPMHVRPRFLRVPPATSRVRGDWAERRALDLLRAQGWWLLSRNWRCRWGELDLVLAKPRRLLLVEVKGRSAGNRDGGGRGALRAAKRRRLERAWRCWLCAHPEQAELPVELVAALVPLPSGGGRPEQPVRWIRLEI
jgi:putative endonuclease